MKKLLLGIVAAAALFSAATASYAQLDQTVPEKPWTISAGLFFHNDDIAPGVKVDDGWSLSANYTFASYPNSEGFLNLQTDFYTVKTPVESKKGYTVTPHVGYRYYIDTDRSIYVAPSAGISYSNVGAAGYDKKLTDISASVALGLVKNDIRAEIYWNAIPGHNLNDDWGLKVGYRL